MCMQQCDGRSMRRAFRLKHKYEEFVCTHTNTLPRGAASRRYGRFGPRRRPRSAAVKLRYSLHPNLQLDCVRCEKPEEAGEVVEEQEGEEGANVYIYISVVEAVRGAGAGPARPAAGVAPVGANTDRYRIMMLSSLVGLPASGGGG